MKLNCNPAKSEQCLWSFFKEMASPTSDENKTVRRVTTVAKVSD